MERVRPRSIKRTAIILTAHFRNVQTHLSKAHFRLQVRFGIGQRIILLKDILIVNYRLDPTD